MIVEKPMRSSWSYTQTLAGTPEDVFPLLCPVREKDWIPSWSPLLVASESGLVEPGCIFVTEDSDRSATWFVADHDPVRHFVRMIKIEPDHVATELTVQLKAKDSGCLADVAYTYTALGGSGRTFVQSRTKEWWVEFMTGWESLLNRYLEAGSIRADDGPPRSRE